MPATVSNSAPDASAASERDPGQVQTQAARSRVEIYALLAALLRQAPNVALLARLATLELPQSGTGEPALTTAWRRLKDAAGTAHPDAIDDEFHRLFIGMGRGEVLPYGSWYLAGALMDRPLVAVRSDLARLGIVRDATNREPEDHAAALCETMALLADPAEGVSHSAQRQFLLMHMAPWLERLWADMRTADGANDGSTGFYSAVAALGAAFLAVEQSWLSLPE